MPFPVHDGVSAPEAARDALESIHRHYGFVPNLAGVLAESPPTLKGYLGAMNLFEDREMKLSALERQVVLLAVSVKNGCAYCSAAHGMLAYGKGLGSLELDHLQHGRPLSDPRLETLRRFAERLVELRGGVPEEDVQAFLAAGFSQAHILEVIFGVSLKTLTNYVNRIAQPPVNAQFAAFLPGRTTTIAEVSAA